MWSKIWWQKVADRMVRAAAYTFTTLAASDVTGVKQMDWDFIGAAVLTVSLLSFAGSVLTTGFGRDKGDPSLA